MSNRRADWISLIEASYALEGSDQDWLSRLHQCAEPLVNRGDTFLAMNFRATAATFRLESFSKQSPAIAAALVRLGHRIVSPAWIDLCYRSGYVIESLTGIEERMPDQVKVLRTLGKVPGWKDILQIGAYSGTGRGQAFVVLLNEETAPTPIEQKRWPRVSAHIGAGLRLRTAAQSLRLESPGVDAILDSSGTVHHAEERAAETSARENLRNAVRSQERARTNTGRSDPDQAMLAWEGLVAGHWSLVDKFDSDGRRFIAAVANEPHYRDPRGLTQRERQVAEFMGLGRSTKEIAYTLGVSASVVSDCSARIQTKLGLSSRPEVVSFFAPNGLRAKLAEMALSGETLLVGNYPLIDESALAPLSEAERAVVVDLIAGSTNLDIAHRRGTSERTVANQLQSIYRKLSVRSRSELAARLQAAR